MVHSVLTNEPLERTKFSQEKKKNEIYNMTDKGMLLETFERISEEPGEQCVPYLTTITSGSVIIIFDDYKVKDVTENNMEKFMDREHEVGNTNPS